MRRLLLPVLTIIALWTWAGCEPERGPAVLESGLDIDSSRLRPGLLLTVQEGTHDPAGRAEPAPATGEGVVPRVQYPDIGRTEPITLRFRGYLRVPFDDLYIFEITSYDSVQLFLNDRLILAGSRADHDSPVSGATGLAKGHHRLRLLSVHRGDRRDLELRVRRSDGPYETVPDRWYYVDDPLAADEDLPLTDAP